MNWIGLPVFSLAARVSDQATSSAVNGEPSCQVTPSRTFIVTFFLSSLQPHSVSRPGAARKVRLLQDELVEHRLVDALDGRVDGGGADRRVPARQVDVVGDDQFVDGGAGGQTGDGEGTGGGRDLQQAAAIEFHDFSVSSLVDWASLGCFKSEGNWCCRLGQALRATQHHNTQAPEFVVLGRAKGLTQPTDLHFASPILPPVCARADTPPRPRCRRPATPRRR